MLAKTDADFLHSLSVGDDWAATVDLLTMRMKHICDEYDRYFQALGYQLAYKDEEAPPRNTKAMSYLQESPVLTKDDTKKVKTQAKAQVKIMKQAKSEPTLLKVANI